MLVSTMNLRGIWHMTISTIKKSAHGSNPRAALHCLLLFYAFRNRFQIKPSRKNRVAVSTMAEPETILK